MAGTTAGLFLMDPRKVVDLFLGEWMPNQARYIPVAWVIFDEQGWVTLHERRSLCYMTGRVLSNASTAFFRRATEARV